MDKLYPPKIETTIPAMTYNFAENNGQIKLTVPFQLNNAVSSNEIGGIRASIKTVSTGTSKGTYDCIADYVYSPTHPVQQATFTLPAGEFKIGQYYKVQIAFLDTKEKPGYYSSVGIVKYTSVPTLRIDGLSHKKEINNSQYVYTGIYKQTPVDIKDGETTKTAKRDNSEKVYSYCFTIYNDDGTIFDTSDIQLHNTNNDTEKDQSIDTWATSKFLTDNKKYLIEYSITTINGYSKSYSCNIKSSPSGSTGVKSGEFIATLYEEDGYVDLHLRNTSLGVGDYVISRASNEDNYQSWIELLRFNLSTTVNNAHLCDDFTVVQGVRYRYGLQKISKGGTYSKRIQAVYYQCEADEKENYQVKSSLPVDFEDAYLFDGERQLRIRYNPKVASFKSTILESKVDTLGGKYPFIFRNGNVEYKEFSISGLISATMDPHGKFLPAAARMDALRNETPADDDDTINVLTTDLNRENFRKEREFKMEVLAWLTNGKPKLFRSPGEGNYIVRTMNASMTPNDTLGRMLHTFTCTAYEIAECNFVNLKLYELFGTINKANAIMLFNEIDLASAFNLQSRASIPSYGFANYGGARYLYFENQYSELVIEITYLNGISVFYNVGNLTGKYLLSGIEDNPIISIAYKSGEIDNGAKVVFGYYNEDQAVAIVSANEATAAMTLSTRAVASNNNDTFDQIYRITQQDITQQFIGIPSFKTKNLIGTKIEKNVRCSPTHFYLIKIIPKAIIKVDGNMNTGYYYVGNDNIPSTEKIYTWDSTALYYNISNKRYYCGKPTEAGRCSEEGPDYTFSLNNKQYTNLETTLWNFEEGNVIQDFQSGIDTYQTGGRFESITNVGEVDILRVGDGLICDMVYVQQTTEYNIEYSPLNQKYPGLMDAKTNWENDPTEENYQNYINQLEMIVNA